MLQMIWLAIVVVEEFPVECAVIVIVMTACGSAAVKCHGYMAGTIVSDILVTMPAIVRWYG